MSNARPVHLVDDEEGLQGLVSALSALPADRPLGVDTEFHAERRYSPELMLLQLAAPGGQAWVVDPRRLDLSPLRGVLSGRPWVAHGAQTDVKLLQELDIVPAALLDTQVLAGMTGHGYPRRLTDLAREILGEEAGDGSTLTDWAQRPLTDAQLRYAAEDALLVLRLAEALGWELPPQRERWWRQAGAEIQEEARAPVDPSLGWRTMEIAPRLDSMTRRILHHLHNWREQRARETNQPPWYILTDGLALDLARRRPTTMAELARNRKIPAGLLKRHGEELVRQVRLAQADPSPPPQVLSLEQDQVARLLDCWARAMERSLRIASSLLLPPALSWKLAMEGSAAFTGWRREAAGPALDDFLAGRTALGVQAGRIAISGDVRLG